MDRMRVPDVPDAAVQIAADVIGTGVPACVAREVVTALALRGWLCDPAERRRHAEAAQTADYLAEQAFAAEFGGR